MPLFLLPSLRSFTREEISFQRAQHLRFDFVPPPFFPLFLFFLTTIPSLQHREIYPTNARKSGEGMSREIIREAYSADRTALDSSARSVFLSRRWLVSFACPFLLLVFPRAFIRARPITFLPPVLFIRWSEINCVGLERDYKGRCHSYSCSAPFIPRLFEYILKT